MRYVRRMPFTVALVVVLLGAAVASGPMRGPAPAVRDPVGVHLESLSPREWWSLITADLFVDNRAQPLAVIVAAAIGVRVAERLMGTRRTLVGLGATGVLGFGLGLGAQALGAFAGEFGADSVR